MKARRVTLFGFFCLFLVELFINQGVTLEPFQWVMLALAGSMIGMSCSYLLVFDWFRFLLVKTIPHSSGAGEDNHPRWEPGNLQTWKQGVLSAVAELVCCPICAGTQGVGVILSLYHIAPGLGNIAMIALSAAAGGCLFTNFKHLVEWQSYTAREQTGYLMKLNAGAVAPLEGGTNP